MLDRSQQGDIDKFNKLLQQYQDILDPGVADSRETLGDEIAKMKDLFPSSVQEVPVVKGQKDDSQQAQANIGQKLHEMNNKE